jgi:hypothetical protein
MFPKQNYMITMNTKNLLLLASLTLAMPLTAQTPQEDFKRDITLSGSNYVAYRGPQKQLTAAPKGYYIGDASDSTDSARGFQAGYYAFG